MTAPSHSPSNILQDLEKSGLSVDDMMARPLENPERAVTGIPSGIQGYVIPYFDINGELLSFYRARTFNFDPKYKQAKNVGNHLYFPMGFRKALKDKQYLIITEGEKKAAKACKEGFPCVALTGVDSWRNRTLIMPEGTKLKPVPGKDKVAVKMNDNESSMAEQLDGFAVGLQPLIDLCVDKGYNVILCYDTDKHGVSFEVQRAMASFAFELRFRGIRFDHLKQMVLPKDGNSKWGLDDYLVHRGSARLQKLIDETLANKRAFPRHPNVQDYIQRKLNKQKLFRKEAQQIAMCILADLDIQGQRLYNPDSDTMYYFQNDSRTLYDASLRRSPTDMIVTTKFSKYIWNTYGIGPNDRKVLEWISILFASEQPIDEARPAKVLKVFDDRVCLQLNDGEYVKITSDPQDPIKICTNGTDGVLFEADAVEPLDSDKLYRECMLQMREPIAPLWPKVLKEVRLKDKEQTPQVLSLLFYLAPYLQRWRGTQLPIEMAIGEPGSGKSSLYELRLLILTGQPNLRNAPRDIKDWHASVTNTGGMHVTDNVAINDKNMRQTLSDEMCRLVTEPNPKIEQRKYFTNSDLIKIPVHCSFALTAVQQPFHNADLLQRSIIMEFDKGEEEVEYETRWSELQLQRYGGRYRWLGHHIVILHKFLHEAQKSWNPRYLAKFRLINMEQALIIMGKVTGMADTSWIPKFLGSHALGATRDADWAFQGLLTYAEEVISSGNTKKRFFVKDIAEWASMEEEFSQCMQLTNTRMLGRYMSAHKQMLATVAGFREMGKYGNRDSYVIDPSIASMHSQLKSRS